MRTLNIIINIEGFVKRQERGESVIAYICFTNRKKNSEVYIGKIMMWKAIGSALYASTEIRDHDFCVPYFKK